MSYPSPVLRIEVEGVRHSLLQHLSRSSDEMAEIVAAELESIDIEQMIRHEVRANVRPMVSLAVKDAMDSIRRSLTARLIEDLRDEIEKIQPRER